MDPAPELVDRVRLEKWLNLQSPSSEPVMVERLAAGHSNLTFIVSRGGEEWILRRPPRGPLLPTAHDVLREFRVMSLLRGSAQSVRVPEVDFACDDTMVIGAPFYLMRRVPGVVIRDSFPSWLSDDVADAEARHALVMDMVAALAEIHAVEVGPFIDAGIGRPSGYLERQLRRWIGQREGVQAAFAAAGSVARDLPDYDIVRDWLVAHLPTDTGDASLVHGDYKLDNVIVADGTSRVAAVVDWEMATVGDPLADLGYLLSFWTDPGEDASGLALGFALYSSAGFPNQQEVIDHYGALTGRSMREVRFYITLAIWKLAVLLEGNYARHLAGTADDPFYEILGEGVPLLLARARAICGA